MKRSIVLLLSILTLFSCVSEKEEAPVVPVGDQELIFTASFNSKEQTRTILVEGKKVWWMPGDRISVSGANDAFVATAEENIAVTSFVGTAPVSDVYYAVYPFESVARWTGNSAVVNVPVQQNAVKGTFADDLNISVAVTSSQDMTFSFQNLLGYMKFSVGENTGAIKSLEVKTNSGEDISGTAFVSFDTASGEGVLEPLALSQTVTLYSDSAWEPGDYYVAMIPGKYETGLTLTFTDVNGGTAVKSVTGELVLDKGVIQDLGVLPALEFEGGEEVVPDDDEFIDFLDNATEVICVNNWDTDGDNRLSYAEAAAVESVGTIFKGTNINSFDEFKFFTSVKALDYQAFFECKQLTKLTLPSSIEEMGQYAITRTSLKEIVIPASVQAMGYDRAVIANANMERIVVEEGNTVYDSRNGCNAIIRTESNTLVSGCVNTIIPDGIVAIGERAFMESNIESVTIPNTVKTIGAQAFYSARPNSVIIGNGVETWGNNAFVYCTGNFVINSNIPDYDSGNDYQNAPFRYCYLNDITFGPDVTYIGSNSFPNCNYINKVTIPKNVTHLGSDIFCKVVSVQEIDVDCPVISDFAFYMDAITKLTIGDNVKSIGNSSFEQSKNLKEITMGDGVESIAGYAFRWCRALETVDLSNSLKSVGAFAFGDCSALKSIDLPESLEEMDEYAFGGCTALASVDFPTSLATVGERVFEGCTSLTDFDFTSVKYIKNGAFKDSGLTSINLPEGLLEIGQSAFSGCSKSLSCYIPSSVTKMGSGAFWGCAGEVIINSIPNIEKWDASPFYHSEFTRIEVTDKVKAIPDYAFYGNKSLTELALSDDVEALGEGAFYECAALKNITLPSALTSLGAQAFSYCSALEEITLPSTLSSIGSETFRYCVALTKAVISDGITTLPRQMFAECYNLADVQLPNTLKVVEEQAFEDCDALVEITLPESIESMKMAVFLHADQFCRVYCKSTTPFEIDWNQYNIESGYLARTFNDDLTKIAIYVPTQSVSDYCNAWKYYDSVIYPYEF